MDNVKGIEELMNINDGEGLKDLFSRYNIDVNGKEFKSFLKKVDTKKELDDSILEGISGGASLSAKTVNTLKWTGALFLAIGIGVGLGNLHAKSKNKRESDLLSNISNYWGNIVNYNQENPTDKNIEKLNRTAITNMAQMGRYSLNEILNNENLYSDFMGMFSQSPADIINYHA